MTYGSFNLIGILVFVTLVVLLVILVSFSMKKKVYKETILRPSLYANFAESNGFEVWVYRELRKHFSQNQVFLNYLLGSSDKTTQIDHIVITQKAIFVIEAKDYKGFVKADINQQDWFQKLKYFKSIPSKYVSYSKYGNPYRRYYLKEHLDTHKIYNPVLQNQGHINALKYHLSDLKIPFVNVVVFSDRVDLVVLPFNKNDVFILQQSELIYTLKAYLNTRANVISVETMSYVENMLICLNSSSSENIRSHVNRLLSKSNQTVKKHI